MPVIHVVLHAYNSWNADHPNGWHQHGVTGVLRPCKGVAAYREGSARWEESTFPITAHGDLIALAQDIAQRRDWRLHAVLIDLSHMHLVVSWAGSLDQAGSVQAAFKRILGLRLAAIHDVAGRRWFSRGGVPLRIRDGAHLAQLLYRYLPGHKGATYWREGLKSMQRL